MLWAVSMTVDLLCGLLWYVQAENSQHSVSLAWYFAQGRQPKRAVILLVQDPVCTPEGYLYSKEAIVENMAAQRKNIKRKLAVFGQQQEEIQRKVTLAVQLFEFSAERSLKGNHNHGDHCSACMQAAERTAVSEQTQLIAFDRQNHMGASGVSASNLSKAIREEAEAMLSDKRVVSTDVAIQENREKIKV